MSEEQKKQLQKQLWAIAVLQRESISNRVTTKILDFIKTFIHGVDS